MYEGVSSSGGSKNPLNGDQSRTPLLGVYSKWSCQETYNYLTSDRKVADVTEEGKALRLLTGWASYQIPTFVADIHKT